MSTVSTLQDYFFHCSLPAMTLNQRALRMKLLPEKFQIPRYFAQSSDSQSRHQGFHFPPAVMINIVSLT